MASSWILDLDNVTIPTTIAGLRSIIPSHQPVQLTSFPKRSKDLPNYVPVASCGFGIYAVAEHGRRWQHASTSLLMGLQHFLLLLKDSFPPLTFLFLLLLCWGPLSMPTSPILLRHEMSWRHGLPGPTTSSPPKAVRRYDIGVNISSENIPLFTRRLTARFIQCSAVALVAPIWCYHFTTAD